MSYLCTVEIDKSKCVSTDYRSNVTYDPAPGANKERWVIVILGSRFGALDS